MEKIIEINGVLYQRVDTESAAGVPKGIVNLTSDDVCMYNGLVYEDDLFCFEATRCLDRDHQPYSTFEIEFTDKRGADRSDWNKEYIDNPEFLKDLLKGDDSVERECLEIMEEYQMDGLKSLLLYIEVIGW